MARKNRLAWVCRLAAIAACVLIPGRAGAQVDPQRAEQFFKEAATLCARDAGRLWGVSLCGPIAVADAQTKTRATSQPAPDAPPPPALGFANAAMDWGGTRWTTLVWAMIPADERQRGVLIVHELFHRVQPQLGLLLPEPDNRHLDTIDGRYWLQLEWRALARAIESEGDDRRAAVRDALAFRRARRALFPNAADQERVLEINEGLAQHTGVAVASASRQDASAFVLKMLSAEEQRETFVRTFAYVSVPAYGLLLDEVSPGWTRRLRPADDVAQMLAAAADLAAADDAEAASRKYGGPALRLAESKRAEAHAARVAALRRLYVDGPVLIMPRPKSASFVTSPMVGIPGAGTVYPTYRTTAEWGTLEAANVLMAEDRSTIAVPAPATTEGTTLKGSDWVLTLAPGWVVRPSTRPGDYQVVRASDRDEFQFLPLVAGGRN